MTANSIGARRVEQAALADVPPKLRYREDARLYRRLTIGLLAVAVLTPVCLIIYQSFLDGPFFSPRSKLSFSAYSYVLTDPMFWKALRTTASIPGFSAMISAAALAQRGDTDAART